MVLSLGVKHIRVEAFRVWVLTVPNFVRFRGGGGYSLHSKWRVYLPYGGSRCYMPVCLLSARRRLPNGNTGRRIKSSFGCR